MSAGTASWGLVGEAKLLSGYGYGSFYPSIILRIAGPATSAAARAELGAILTAPLNLREEPEVGQGDGWADTLGWLLRLIDHVQISCDLPVCEAASALHMDQPAAQIQIPSFSRSMVPLGQLIAQILHFVGVAKNAAHRPQMLQDITAAYQQLAATAIKGSNVPRFLRAAHGLGIPFKEMPGQFYRYGIGRRGCWMNSSFTQNTPYIAAQIAQDKAICAANLRMAGIPVPAHQLVHHAQQSVQVAQAMGYPVVVKPADRDGGYGVAAGLENADQVAAAFEAAKLLSPRVLVEKHVEGRDYRLTVHRGELIWAVERVPAGVTGNGRDSVAALVEASNADPRRSRSAHSPLKPLTLDTEADALLEKQGVSRDDIVPDGDFIRLRRAANVNSGGMPVAVFDQVHPDNARLAVAAAQALRLDLAGIDLLIPNIAQSWRETGGAICEVNGQPQLGGTTAMHIYPQILQKEVQGNGRVPTVLLWGSAGDDDRLRDLEAELAAQGLVVGWHDANGVRIDGEMVMSGNISLLQAGEMMAGRPDVDVMVLTVAETSPLETGLPVPRVDLIVDAGGLIAAASQPNSSAQDACIAEMKRMLAPACDGMILVANEAAARQWPVGERAILSGVDQISDLAEKIVQLHRRCAAASDLSISVGVQSNHIFAPHPL